MTFRLTTWNVLVRERAARFDTLLARLRDIDSDVVLLQESSPGHAQRLADELGLIVACAAGSGRDDEVSVPAILTRSVPLRSEQRPLGSDSEARPYFVLSADFDVAGTTVRVCTTHLRHTVSAGLMGVDSRYRDASRSPLALAALGDDNLRGSTELRLRQLAEIREHLDTLAPVDAFVIGGDFNFLPDGAEYHAMLQWGLLDAWRGAPRLGSGATIIEANPLIGEAPGYYRPVADAAFPGQSGALDYTLDFQLHSAALLPQAGWTVGAPSVQHPTWASDHLGIVMQYDIG